jgi:hypothetical protein
VRVFARLERDRTAKSRAKSQLQHRVRVVTVVIQQQRIFLCRPTANILVSADNEYLAKYYCRKYSADNDKTDKKVGHLKSSYLPRP